MRILHIVENLDKGAVETWLVHVYEKITSLRPEWNWTFFCILNKAGRWDDIVISSGAKIIFSPFEISQKISFLRHLRHVIKLGKFNIIHAHHDLLSGFYLLSAMGLQSGYKILHIHNNDEAVPVTKGLKSIILASPLRLLSILLSDHIIGISRYTLSRYIRYFAWLVKMKQVLYYGVNLMERKEKPSQEILKQYNFPVGTKIALFIGRLNEFKNPLFALDIFIELNKLDTNWYGLIVGKGELENKVIEKIQSSPNPNRIQYLGWTDKVADLMNISDAFIFPRLPYPKEGLGLVVVEAQSCGLPTFISEGIVDDAIIIPELITRISINLTAAQWATKINSYNRTISKQAALNLINTSYFSMDYCANEMIKIYEQNRI